MYNPQYVFKIAREINGAYARGWREDDLDVTPIAGHVGRHTF